jgi:glycosyltransferase involved in cell wall biosynthesis
MHKKVKVCFVGLYTYQLFNPDFKGIFGGSEVRASIIMKELAKDDQFEIINIVNADPGVVEGVFDGVHVVKHSYYKHNYQGEGTQKLPFLKRLLPETLGYYAYKLQLLLTDTFNKVTNKFAYNLFGRGLYGKGDVYIPQVKIDAYDKIDADIYCIFGVKSEAYELFTFCKSRSKKSILFIGSDSDLDKEYTDTNKSLNRYGSRHDLNYYSIIDADTVIAQNQDQLIYLSERFTKKATLVNNPICVDPDSGPLDSNEIKNKIKKPILWVGKSHSVKSPEKVVAIAKTIPDFEITMVMNLWDEPYHRDILLTIPSNVTYIDRVEFDKIEDLFMESSLFINTSDFEGFPNTFLQAAKHGVPIISLNSDPNRMLSEFGCGYCANGDIQNMAIMISNYLSDTKLYTSASNNAIEYVLKYHNMDSIVTDLTKIIRSLV